MENTRSGRHRGAAAAATALAATAPAANFKRFACTFAGCEKRFTRAEHLQRHALNHSTVADHACPRCMAAFKRPDLLDRHIRRHRQKDAEAGGEGCGVLDTRKRAWKAVDGTVAERRPIPLDRSRARSRRGTPTQAVETQLQQQQQQHLPTSPVSDQEAEDLAFAVGNDTGDQQPEQQPPFDLLFTSLLSSSATEDPWQLWNEQPFQPDTASSFNMPYTTALDYNWLFNMIPPTTVHHADPGQTPDPLPMQQTPYGMTPCSSSIVTSIHDGSLASFGSASDRGSHDADADHADHDPFSSSGMAFHSGAAMPSQPMAPSPGSSRRYHRSGHPSQHMPQPVMHTPTHTPIRPFAETERPLSLLNPAAPLPSIDRATHERLLAVIEGAKPCLPLPYANSGSDSGSVPPLRDCPLLAPAAVQAYLNLFFTRFNSAYPIVHAASFDPAAAEPLLLLAMVLLGATYAAKDAHQVAVCIHDVIRPSVFAHDGFSAARPALWTLQTILLVESFGKSRAGQKQHDMSHLFHGLLINLIRRSDCPAVRPQGPPPATRGGLATTDSGQLEQAWRKWAEAEQKKRLALYCFMWDTQHAVLFCQSLCMSAFELRLHFPCSQLVWEAPDPAAWAAAWWAATPPPAAPSTPSDTPLPPPPPQQPFYLPTLRAYLSPGSPRPPVHLNAHARVLVLHGLMSIFWDLQRRDQTTLGAAVGASSGHWRHTIAAAYDLWKADFDAYCACAGAAAAGSDLPEMATFAAATNAVYHAAQCLLRMEFIDIQIYAGARNILGRPVQQRDYLRSAQVVKWWASAAGDEGSGSSSSAMAAGGSTAGPRRGLAAGADAAGAAWHAARMLRAVVPEADSDAMASLFHVPWCLYLATLTCWAFYHASPSRGPAAKAEHLPDELDAADDASADEMVWDSHAEMEALVAGMTAAPDAPLRLCQRPRHAQSRRRTNGLVWVMADTLAKVRWGIVHAGVIVLRGLVPARLINQYEAEE